MFGESGNSYTDTCVKLKEIAIRSEFKVEQTIENQKKYTSLESQIQSCQKMIDTMNAVMTKIKPWIADLQEYNAQKKSDSLVAINSALAVANFVVPSSMKGIHFNIEGNEAWLENEQGMDADRLEGSGYKGAASVYLRNVVLRANSDLLPFMYLDEPLAKLSVEASAIFSKYVPMLAENMQIIWVEHKKEVFENVDTKIQYTFFKDEKDHTVVLKEG